MNHPIFALGGHGSVSSEAEKSFKKNPNHSDLSHAVPGSDLLTDHNVNFYGFCICDLFAYVGVHMQRILSYKTTLVGREDSVVGEVFVMQE